MYTLKEERELELITRGLSYDGNAKHWVINYPCVKNPINFPNNVSVALARLNATEKHLTKLGTKYCKIYQSQIEDMINRTIALKLSQRKLMVYDTPIFCIPHMEVIELGSTSTPMLNALAKYLGHELNEYLAEAPHISNSLLVVLLRFRENAIGLTCDISKMYNSIRMSTFVLMDVPFGNCPSGANAINVLKFAAQKFIEKFHIACHQNR